MTERILPTPDAFATCPTDGKILEYYSGTFEAVYILFHPFIKTVSIDKATFNPATYPGRTTVVKNCVPVSWAEVAARAKLPSIAAVDIGLRTMIGGLKKQNSQTKNTPTGSNLYSRPTRSYIPRKAASLTCSTTPCFRPFSTWATSGSGLATNSEPRGSCTG